LTVNIWYDKIVDIKIYKALLHFYIGNRGDENDKQDEQLKKVS